MKRYLIKRSEIQADQIAIAALKKMEEASKKLEKSQQSLSPVVPIQNRRSKFHHFLRASFALIFLRQKKFKPKCKHKHRHLLI